MMKTSNQDAATGRDIYRGIGMDYRSLAVWRVDDSKRIARSVVEVKN